MSRNQRAGHVVTDGIGVDATLHLATLVQQGAQSARVGPAAGGGQLTVLRRERKASDRIDGRLTKSKLWVSVGGNGEEAQILLPAGRLAAPTPPGGAAQLSRDRELLLSRE
jgi:hypothetical protein